MKNMGLCLCMMCMRGSQNFIKNRVTSFMNDPLITRMKWLAKCSRLGFLPWQTGQIDKEVMLWNKIIILAISVFPWGFEYFKHRKHINTAKFFVRNLNGGPAAGPVLENHSNNGLVI